MGKIVIHQILSYFYRIALYTSNLVKVKKYFITCLLALISCSCFGQFSWWEKAYAVKPYKIAVTFSNPASAMLKYGGGVEYRRYRTSHYFGYSKYSGAYFGKQYDWEFRFYFRKYWEHAINHWRYQDFYYFRSIMGDMGYDGQKFAVLGQKEDKFADLQFYAGSATGFGRRYHKGALFFSVKGGIRALALPGLDPEYKSLYRLFYFTGPGSIVEVNFQMGLQI